MFLSCLKEILYRERHRDPFYLIGAIRCMPSPYPEGRSRLYESLKPLLARGALHVLLYHCPSKCFVVACRQNNAVPLSADEMELFILLFKVAQECHSDILGYLQLERIYQQVNILFDSIGDDSEWLVLVVVKKKERDCVLKAWSQYKKDWTQQLQTGPIQKDLNGYLQNPLDCKIISYHLRLLFSVDVMFYYRGLHLLVYTEAWNTLLEKDNLKKVWTKEKVTDILVHKDKGHTWLCHSIGDNPPVNIVLFLPFESKEEYYMQLVKNIQNWFYHKQMSLFPFEWLEYFHGNNKPSIWKWF